VDKEKETAAVKEQAAINTLKNVLKEQPSSDAKAYMGLLMEADEAKLKGGYTRGEQLLKKAVDLNPQNPMAYAALGEIMGLTNKPQAAAMQYVKAVELFPKKTAGNNPQGKNLWASSMLSAIFWLNVPGGKAEDQPAWFNDEELKELTAQLCEQAPQDLRSWQTRAFVLCPMPDMPPQWKLPATGMMRTEAELQEAGRCWQQVMRMTPGGREEKRPYVARAAHCFKTAQVVAERVAAQQAAQGMAEPPPADEVKPVLTKPTTSSGAATATMEKQMAALARMEIQQQKQEAVPAW